MFRCFTLQTLLYVVISSQSEENCSPHESPAKMGTVLPIENISKITETEVEEIRSSLLRHGVVVIPGQGHVSRKRQIEFARTLGRFGIVPFPVSFNNDPEPGYPEIQRVSNYFYNGTWKGQTYCLGCHWHKDWAWSGRDYVASMLYAEEVAPAHHPTSRPTLFLNTCHGSLRDISYAARAALSRTMFAASAFDLPNFVERGTKEEFARYPRYSTHPGLYLHPENNRTCFYITHTLNTLSDLIAQGKDVSGAEVADGSGRVPSERYSEQGGATRDLSAVWDEVIGKSPRYLHHWRAGDIVIWDNLAVMHRGSIDAEGRGGEGREDVYAGGYSKGGHTKRVLFRTQAYM